MFDAPDEAVDTGASQRIERVHPAAAGALALRFDNERRLIVIDCHGLWTPAQVDICFDELKILTGTMRARFSRVRVLVDRRSAVPQPPETVERLRRQTEIKYSPGDRVAVIVDSSLSKMQLRDELDRQTHMLFLSENAAMMWLSA